MGKTAILIDHDAGNNVTVVQTGNVPTEMKINGTEVKINPATGQPMTSVPGFVSELATLLTGKQSVDAGKANPNQSEGPSRKDWFVGTAPSIQKPSWAA